MNPPRKPRIIDWIGCGAIALVGVALLGCSLFTRLRGITPEDELTLAEGVPEEVTVEIGEQGTAHLDFTVAGFRIKYSSTDPRYADVLAAVQSGQPVRAWVSTRQETLFPRKGWVPLYKLSTADGEALDYDSVAADMKGVARGFLIGGCVVLAVGLFALGACLRQHLKFRRLGGGPVPELTEAQRQEQRKAGIRFVTVFVSLVFYALIIGVNFGSEARQKQIEAFGPTPLGLPVTLFVSLVETLLFLPVPWFIWHASTLTFQAAEEGRHPGILNLLRAGRGNPQLRRARWGCLLGLLYFFTIVAAWIIYTAIKGI